MALKITSRKWFILIVLTILITDFAIFFDVPFLKKIFAFIFLTFLPGLLILRILKLNKLHFLPKLLILIGLSISFLIFFGLLFNGISLALGYNKPLTKIPILITLNFIFIFLALIAHLLNKTEIIILPRIELIKSEKIFLIPLVFFPLLSITGMQIMNNTGNNILLMIFIAFMSLYVAFVCFFNRYISIRILPIVIFIISLSLVILLPFRSNHILGYDIHLEYYLFQIVSQQSYWSIGQNSLLDSCLSITLLPAIYQSISDMNGEILYRFFYPLIFSIMPLIVYTISKKYVKEIYALLASFFFISQEFFLGIEMYPRTSIAILFFALAIMVIFNEQINSFKKRILFIIFMVCCILSHYTTTYLFLFILLISCIVLIILSKKYKIKKEFNLSVPILLFSLMFLWYSQISGTSFEASLNFFRNMFDSLQNFFITESRTDTFRELFGVRIVQENIAYRIKFIITWITFGLIGLGILGSIKRYNMKSTENSNNQKLEFFNVKVELEYLVVGFTCGMLLLMAVLIPFIIGSYDIHRIFSVVTIILSLFFIIGGIVLSDIFISIKKLFFKHKNKLNNTKCNYFSQIFIILVLLMVLIPMFFSNIGFVYILNNDSRPIILSSNGETYNTVFLHDEEVSGVKWLEKYRNDNLSIYTDMWQNYFYSQGNIGKDSLRYFFTKDENIKGYIFFRYYNIIDKKFLWSDYQTYNISKYYNLFSEKDKVYTSNGSEIWG